MGLSKRSLRLGLQCSLLLLCLTKVALDHKGNAHLYQYTPHSDGREGDWVEAGAAVDYNRFTD